MAPKRQRSPPPKSGRSSKRRAGDAAEASQPPDATQKIPPRQRLQGLALSPTLAAPSRNTLPKKVPPPPPRKKQQKEAALPSPTSSSSRSVPSEDNDHKDTLQQQQQRQEPQEPQQAQYPRVKAVHLKLNPKYRPLIPTTLDPLAFASNKNKNALTTFGATFLSSDQAAVAADRALIAMWGYKAAAPYLHFPQPNYYKIEDQQQRFGHHLTAFLLSICQEAEALKKTVVRERERSYHRAVDDERERRKKIVRIRDHSTSNLINEVKDCGLCAACRQPWLGEVCERRVTARKFGYNSLKIAEKMLENGVEIEEEVDDSGEEEEEEEEEHHQGAGAYTAATTAAKRKPRRNKKSTNDLIWLEEPPKGKYASTARVYHSRGVESTYKHSEAMAMAKTAAEVAALTAALASNRSPGLATAFPPRDFMMQPPQYDLLRHAVDCAAAGVDLTLTGEDDPRWIRPVDPRGALQCSLCYGWHAVGSRDKECPVNQAANAVEPPGKELCSECDGIQGCSRCGRGDLPAAVWAPAAVPCAWIDNVKPATLDVMQSVQSMASAAAVDFDRPDVAGKLGPEALLAFGLLAEEITAAQVAAQTLFDYKTVV